MSSQIDATKPEQGQATTASVRANFAAAKDEILDLQAAVGDLETFTGFLDQLKAMIEAGTLTFSGGNVGIGTNNPQRKLTVQGVAGDNVPVRVISGTGSIDCFIDIKDPTTTEDYRVRVGSVGDDLVLYAGGLERMRIDALGRAKKPYTPAFSAYRSSQPESKSSLGGPLVFQGEIFNTGGHYNTTSGLFTAPVDGIYSFSVSANIRDANPRQFAFAVNGIIAVRIYADLNGSWAPISMTHTVKLAQNDQVSIWWTGLPDYGWSWCNFSGHLIG